jgi:hypothetical protein
MIQNRIQKVVSAPRDKPLDFTQGHEKGRMAWDKQALGKIYLTQSAQSHRGNPVKRINQGRHDDPQFTTPREYR